MSDDSSSEEVVTSAVKKQEVPARSPPAAIEEDSSSDEDVPARGAPAKPAKAPAAVEDSSDEEDEDEPAKGVASKPAKPESDSDEEEEDVKVVAAAKAPVVEEDSDDDDVEEAPTITLTQKATPVQQADEDDSDDEDETPPAKSKSKAKLEAETPAKIDAKSEKGQEGPAPLRIFVRGLPFKAKEQEVRDVFKKCGFIKSINMPNNKDGKPSGNAYLAFKTEEAVQLALKLNGDTEKFPGRKLDVTRAQDKDKKEAAKVDASNGAKDKSKKSKDKNKDKSSSKEKSGSKEEDSLKLPELKNVNGVLSVKLLRTLMQASESNTFSVVEDVCAKIIRRTQSAKERVAKAKEDRKKLATVDKNYTVFVTGLPMQDFNEEAFKARFADCGAIKHVWLPLKKDGNVRGYGSVSFKSDEAFTKALAYNGTKCKGSVLTVRKSKPQEDRGKTDEAAEEGSKGKRKAESAAEETQAETKPAKKSKKVAVEEAAVESESKVAKKKDAKAEKPEAEEAAKKKSKKAR